MSHAVCTIVIAVGVALARTGDADGEGPESLEAEPSSDVDVRCTTRTLQSDGRPKWPVSKFRGDRWKLWTGRIMSLR